MGAGAVTVLACARTFVTRYRLAVLAGVRALVVWGMPRRGRCGRVRSCPASSLGLVARQ